MSTKPDALTDHPGHRVHDRMDGDNWKRTELREDRAANCSGVIAASNCSGDNFWNIPDTDWWNWPGIGGSASNRSKGTILSANPANPSVYDFAGGQNTSETPIADDELNVRNYTTGFSLFYETSAVEVQQRDYNNCSNGVTVNCYSNCNCNCACVCACYCDCNCHDN